MYNWREQVAELRIPYPHKANLAKEIEDHVIHFPEEEHGLLGTEALTDLYQIHNNVFFQVLQKLRPKIRCLIEIFFAAAPITALLLYLAREKFMYQFMHEGGPGMYLILAVGLTLLARELVLLLRVLVIKDHSKQNLRIDSMTVIIGTMALVLLGICASGLGAYKAASWVEHQNLPMNVLLIGLKESITCFVLSSLLAAFVLLLHFFTRRTLINWKVPESLTA